MRLNSPALPAPVARFVRSIVSKAASRLSLVAFLSLVPSLAPAQTTLKLLYTINAYAGTGTAGNAGIPGPALNAQLSRPSGLAFDTQGNVYIADNSGAAVYKVNNLGQISIVAGTGVNCATSTSACGDGGQATQAQLSLPYALAFDGAGNLYIADGGDNKVRRVAATTGVITTVVGTGTDGNYPSTTLAAGTSVNIHNPDGMAIDTNGNIFISDSASSIVYKYATAGANAGKIQAYVNAAGGGGFSGDGGQAATAKINNEIGLAIDVAGNLYIADQLNNRVRRVTPAGIISTIAGNGTAGYAGDGGTAINAEFNAPRSVAIDYAGDLIVSDSQNLVVRIIYATGGAVSTTSYVETLAGSGASCAGGANPCGDGGLAIDGTFQPNGGGNGGSTLFGFDNARGAFYVSDLADNRVRSLRLSTTFPSTAVSGSSTQQVGVQLVGGGATISSITVAPGANGVQEFTVGAVTGQPANTFEGTPALACSTNGTTNNVSGTICNISIAFTPQYPGLRTAQLKVVTSAGTFYYGVSGKGTAPLAVLKNGNISTIAGTGVSGNTSTGTATTSQIATPWGTAVDSQGNIYFADSANNLIRKVTPAGVISTIAGGATTVCAGGTAIGDGCPPTQAKLNGPRGVALDPAGDIFIADAQNEVIREISVQTGLISTIAGGGGGGTASGILATSATLFSPSDLAFDSTGNLYIADSSNSIIRVINSGSQYIFNYAGAGSTCTATAACGDGGQATAASLGTPAGIAVDPQDNLLIADTGNNRIRFVNKNTGVISTVVGTGAVAYTGDGGAATSATLNQPTRIAVDAAGDYYIADFGNNAVRQVLNGTATPTIYSFAGNGTACAASPACGDGAPANAAKLNSPNGVALDGAGNLYIADLGDNEIRKVTVGTAALAFAATQINTTSTDSPKTAYLQNIGNAPLTLTAPGTQGSQNPSISAGFADGSSASCPQLSNGSANGSLVAGTQCSYSISFTPTVLGAYNGQLVETDNSLNVASTQTVTLTGTGLEDNPNVTLSTNPNPSTYNQAVTLSSTVTSATTPTGTVSFYQVGATQIVNMQATGTSTTATQSLNLPAGTYSVAFVGTSSGGLYNGWNSSNNANANNLWTERYTLQLCATCATSIVNLSGNPGYATDTAALAAFQASRQLNNGVAPVGNPLTFTLTAPQVVTFGISDNSLGDDSGGLSLAVTALTAIGTGSVNGSGVATTTTATLPVGSDPVIAIYNGDTNNVSAESPIVTEVVNKDPLSNDTLTASPNPQTFGSTVTLSESVLVAAGDTPPTGTVTFTAPIAGISTTLGTAAVPFAATATTTVINGITYTTYTASTTTAALPPGSNTVTGTYTGDTNYAGGALTTTEQINAAAGTSTLTASPSPSTYGTPVTLTETITPINGVCPAGPATFLNNGTSIGTGAIALTGGQCIATLVTANLPVGTDVLTATVPASNGFAAITTGPTNEVINKAPVTNPTTPALSDTIAATPNPTTFGATDTLSFSVLVAAGDAAPTGSVTFTTPIGGTATTLGTAAVPFAATTTTTVVNGITYTVYTASTTTTALPQGTDTVTGTYTGDGNYAGGALTTNVVVNAAAATSTLTASPSPSTYGTPVTITESINPINGVCPTGPATFLNNGTSIGTGAIALTGGKCVATLVTANLPVGTDALTATVPASNGFAATTTGPTNEVINKAPVTNPTTPALSDTITSNPNPQTLGQPVTLSFSVLAAAGNAAPTGTVTFSAPINGTTTTLGTAAVGFTSGGTTVINGVTYTVYTASTTTSALPQGSNTVTGTYTGDANYAGGPLTTTEQINAANGTANLAVGPNPSTYGTPVTITETITPVNGVCPVGPATFKNNGASIGTGAITLVNGQCVATLTTSTLPVGSDAITATIPADANFNAITSGPVALVVNKANGADTLVSSPNPSTFGQSVTLTDTIPTVGGVAPTGTVNFYSLNTLIGTGTVNAQGVATLSTTTLPVGTDSLTAVYQGDGNYAQVTSNAVNQVVNPVATSATLAAGPNPTTFGTLVTITETVPTINGTPATGTVTFFQNGVQIGTGTINAQGVATLTTTTLPVGSDPITAQYPGDANYAAVNSGPLTVTINKANGADTLAASPNPATFGTTVTLTDTIPTVGGVAPTGTVTFYNNGTSIGTGTVTNGVATLTTTTLPVGSNPLTAVYGGDANYAQVTTNQVNEVITTGSTTPVLSATPNPTTFGTPVTLSESIPGINGVTPTGTVQFYNGTTLLGTGTVTNGVATLTTSTLPIGTDPIKAVYSGDANYATANTGPVNVVINKAAPADTVTSSPNPSIYGGSVTLTFTVPVVNGVAPSGPVSFYNGTTLLGTGTVNAQGVATLATSALPVGSDTITAQYPGDNSYAAASPTTTQVVNQNNGTANLAVGPNPSTYGTPVTITETITPVNGVCPVGPATFKNNGASIGTGAITLVNGQCVATLTTSTLPVGSDAITATIPADANFNAITSGPVALVVNKANGADTLVSSPNPSTFGQSVTLTDTIPTVGGVAPTGTVNFYSLNTLIGTGTVNAQGVATLSTTTLPVGTDSLTAVYQGDGNYAQVTSNAVNQVVNPVATSATLAAGPNPTTFGTLVTITETVPTINGTPATGTVTFFQNGVQIGTGTINAQGVATLTTTTLPVGSDPITAQYPGDANYAAVNSGPLTVTINKANGADTLAASPNPATFGTTVTLTDTIPTVGGVAPTGTVTFYNNGTSIGTGTVTNGVATLTTTTLPVGSNPLTAVYGGDANYAQVTTNQVNEVITTGSTTPVLSATPNPTTFGTPVTLSESIPGINGVTPTGTVQFYNGTTLLGTGTVTNGVATLTTSTLPIGTDPIKAVYSGDANYATANTGPVNVVINKAAPADTVTSSPNPSIYGGSVTLTFTVPVVNGVAPSGPVSFYNGTTLLGTGTVNAQGVATLATSALPVGSDTITAQYPGDNSYAAASPTTTQVVGKVGFGNGDTLTTSNAAPQFGQPVTFTFTVPIVNGVVPTGTVNFYNGTTLIGTGTVNAQGVATLTTSTLPTGTITINGTYSGDANYAGGTLSVIEKVAQNDFSIAATPANITVNPGDTAVYTVSLSGILVPFTSPVTLTATGLPADATVKFGTQTYVPGAGPTPTTMTIVTSPLHAKVEPSGLGPRVFYGLLLLPLLGIRTIRRKIRSLPKGIVYGLAALMMLGGLGAITGCAGGYFGPAGAQYTITVTGTSGTLVHSTTVTLTVR